MNLNEFEKALDSILEKRWVWDPTPDGRPRARHSQTGDLKYDEEAVRLTQSSGYDRAYEAEEIAEEHGQATPEDAPASTALGRDIRQQEGPEDPAYEVAQGLEEGGSDLDTVELSPELRELEDMESELLENPSDELLSEINQRRSELGQPQITGAEDEDFGVYDTGVEREGGARDVSELAEPVPMDQLASAPGKDLLNRHESLEIYLQNENPEEHPELVEEMEELEEALMARRSWRDPDTPLENLYDPVTDEERQQKKSYDSLSPEANSLLKGLGDKVMEQPVSYGTQHNQESAEGGSFQGLHLGYPQKPSAARAGHLRESEATSQKAAIGEEEDYGHPAGSDRMEDAATDDEESGTRPSGFAMKLKKELDGVLKEDDLESSASIGDGEEEEEEDEVAQVIESDMKSLNAEVDAINAELKFKERPLHERIGILYRGPLSVIREKDDEEDARTESEEEDEFEDVSLHESDELNEHVGSAAEHDTVWNAHEEEMARDAHDRKEREERADDVLDNDLIEKPKAVHDCVQALVGEGEDEDSAWAICQSEHSKMKAGALHSKQFEACLKQVREESVGNPRRYANRVSYESIDMPLAKAKSLADHILAFATIGGEAFEKEANPSGCPTCFKVYNEYENPRMFFDACKASLGGGIDASILFEEDYMAFKAAFPIIYNYLTGNRLARSAIP